MPTIINSLPFTLQNGTTADATQVMADFNQIVANVNANAAASPTNADITSLTALTSPPTGLGSLPFYATTIGGTANAITALTVLPTGFTLRAGNIVWLTPTATNTGATTLAVGGTTATAVNKITNGGLAALAGGEIVANTPILVLYDGTRYILLTQPAAAGAAQATNVFIRNNTFAPNTQIDCTADAATLLAPTGLAVRFTSVAVVTDAAVVGPNGIDAGGLVANTWYYLYLISNGVSVAGLLSASSSAPTMPAGYTFKALVGYAKTDGAAVFYRFQQLGRTWRWKVTAATNTAALPLILSGNTGSPTVPTWTAITVLAASGANPLAVVPPGASEIALAVSVLGGSGGAIMAAPNNSYGGVSSPSNPPPMAYNGLGNIVTSSDFMLESAAIYAASSITPAANGVIAARGFTGGVNVT